MIRFKAELLLRTTMLLILPALGLRALAGGGFETARTGTTGGLFFYRWSADNRPPRNLQGLQQICCRAIRREGG
jgi:hypothetical protein